MHVLHLTLPFEYACGISQHVLLLAGEQRHRHRVTVATPGGAATPELDRLGIRWVDMRIGPKHKTPWHAPLALAALARFVKRERVTVLHAHHRYPALLGRIVAAMVPQVHTVATCHSFVTGRRTLSFPAERVIAVSEATRQHLITRLGIPPHRIALVPNALAPLEDDRPSENANGVVPVEPSRPVLVGVGRLERAKGFHTLIQATATLAGRARAPAVVLVGDGPARRELENLGRRLGVHLLITGVVPSVVPYLRRADIFVHPSFTEAFGLAVAEAGLAACPVVCTDVGGLPELVRNGETGLLVAPGDVEGLARAIARLLGDEAGRRRLGEALKHSLTHRTRPDLMADATARVYASVGAL
jgi:glycosyltransferase involved in cell wall biosynthesis